MDLERNNLWLDSKLANIWQRFFADIPKHNKVEIRFGSNARRRLGSIRQVDSRDRNSTTRILITGYFKDMAVPESIIDAVISHELVHYAHGFGSPLPKFSRYPHHGGIVDKELKKRGLAEQLKFQNAWLKSEWPKLIGKPKPRRRTIKRRKTVSLLRIFGLG